MLLLLASASVLTLADEPDTQQSAWHFSIGVGVGTRTNPVEYSNNLPIFLLPQVEYTGERFFVQNLDFGFIIQESNSQQLNLLLTPSYDQMFFDRWSSGNFYVESFTDASFSGTQALPPPEKSSGKDFSDTTNLRLHKRRMTALAGIEYNFFAEDFDIQLQWLNDILDIHQGSEIRFLVGKNWRHNRWSLRTSAGLVWQDEKTLNYYYGLNENETLPSATYYPDAGVSPLLRLDWNYRLTENWDLRLFSSYRQLDDEIANSPIINDDKIVTLFIGGTYHF
jgi:MipA family protein